MNRKKKDAFHGHFSKSKQQMFEEYMYFPRRLAKQHECVGLTYSDIFTVAKLLYQITVHRYDKKTCGDFKSYAAAYIEPRLSRFCKEQIDLDILFSRTELGEEEFLDNYV